MISRAVQQRPLWQGCALVLLIGALYGNRASGSGGAIPEHLVFCDDEVGMHDEPGHCEHQSTAHVGWFCDALQKSSIAYLDRTFGVNPVRNKLVLDFFSAANRSHFDSGSAVFRFDFLPPIPFDLIAPGNRRYAVASLGYEPNGVASKLIASTRILKELPTRAEDINSMFDNCESTSAEPSDEMQILPQLHPHMFTTALIGFVVNNYKTACPKLVLGQPASDPSRN